MSLGRRSTIVGLPPSAVSNFAKSLIVVARRGVSDAARRSIVSRGARSQNARSRRSSAAVLKSTWWPARTAAWAMFCAIIVLPRPWGRHEHDVARAREEVEPQRGLDRRAVD